MGEGHQGHPGTVFPPQQDETSNLSADYTTSSLARCLNYDTGYQGLTRPAEPSEPLRQHTGQNGGRQLREGLAQRIIKTAIQMDKTN